LLMCHLPFICTHYWHFAELNYSYVRIPCVGDRRLSFQLISY
jgi:hypothetical protein